MSYYNGPDYDLQGANEWALECKAIKNAKQEHLRDNPQPEKIKPDPAARETLNYHKEVMTEVHRDYHKTLFWQYLGGEIELDDYKKAFARASDRGEAALVALEKDMGETL